MKAPLAALLAIALAGCWPRLARDDEERPAPPAPAPTPWSRVDLAAVGIRQVAVVELLDRAGEGAGVPVARALHDALARAGVPLHAAILGRPGGTALPGPWLAARARELGVGAFVSGTVSAHALQVGQERAYVACTAIMVDPAGRILWSRRISGAAPIAGLQAALPNGRPMSDNGSAGPGSLDLAAVHRDALAVAAHIAAKEFAHDFVPAR